MLMFPRSWIVLALLLAFAARGAPASTRPSSDVDTLIRQLAGDDWSLRQKAQQKLVALGPDAEPALRKWVAQSHDQESIARAEAALRLIAEGRLVGPTPVTLHLHNTDPAGALEELGRQIGQEISTEPPDLWKQKEWPRVNLDADHEPFWKVMLALCAQLNLEPQPSETTAGLRVGEASESPHWAASPSVVSGPFLLMASGVTRTRTVRFAQPADVDQSCELTLVAYVEPKLRPIHDTFSVHIDRATDDRGQSLLPVDPSELADAVSVTEPDPGRRWEISLDLKLPPALGKRPTATIKGMVSVMVPVKLRSIDVTDVLETHELARRAAGRRLTVQSARRTNGGGIEVTVTLFRDELDDEQWRQFADPRDFVHLADDRGRITPLASVSQSDSGERQATLTLQFAPASPGAAIAGPLKFVWQIPEEIRSVRIPFEYRDLPLP